MFLKSMIRVDELCVTLAESVLASMHDDASATGLSLPLTWRTSVVSQGGFDNIHIDNVGPLPPSNRYVYILTCIKCFTCWPEAIPIRDTYDYRNSGQMRYH